MYKTLWLPSWYPSDASTQNGDFIQRHAVAVSEFAEVYVVYAVPYSENRIDITQRKNLTEKIIYYKKRNDNIAGRLLSFIRYIILFKKNIKTYINDNGKPDIMHVHVSLRAGIFALWLKKKYKIPYVVTEHWTLYTKEKKNNFYKKNFIFKFFAKQVFRHTEIVLPDSEDLGRNIQEMTVNAPYIKVPNVVSDDFYFKKTESENQPFTFIHASSLIERKNPKGIVRAFARLLEYNEDVFLKIIGNKNEELEDLARQLNISSKHILFIDQIPYEEYAVAMRSANAFVLFSYSENFGCVVVESLCCGNPVIATDVGGVAEQLNEGNSILIPAGDEQALLDAMKKMIDNYPKYDRREISEDAQSRYNYSNVGKKINDIYIEVLKNAHH